MSEFKFACPVCGQHITADSSASGSRLECPTCFQKIIVPQAPSSQDPKFIISATQVGKPRPTSTTGTEETGTTGMSAGKKSMLATAAFLVVLCAAGITAYAFRGKLFKSATNEQIAATNTVAKKKGSPPKLYPIPTNIVWSLDLTNAVIPEAAAVGKIHGSGFLCERATLTGGNLTLRQGNSGTADLGVSIQFFAQAGEELSGKKIEITADRQPPLPKVTLRWKDENWKGVTQSIQSGYALQVVFDSAENGRITGKLFLSTPDDLKSVVTGAFVAEIRKPPPPKPKTPKTQQKPQKPKSTG
jgi:DNA-directed RNA polymerase subunit RPC12/RpoP